MSNQLSGWAIAQAYGMTLIGRHSVDQHGIATLVPVFELRPQMAMGPQGMQIAHVAIPIWLLGLNDVDLPPGSLVVSCETFAKEQQARLQQAVDMATVMQKDMRNEGARIALASPDALNGLGRRK
jgi:hypothetical protein